MKKYINDGINKYLENENRPWHMPGHKRKDCGELEVVSGIFGRDFTEVPGLDDYYHPVEMIKDSLAELKKVYGVYASYYLVNGSTVGNLAAIFACCNYEENSEDKSESNTEENNQNISNRRKKAIIIARNCHKSVFNALKLLDIKPIYVYPSYQRGGLIYGDVKKESIERAIEANKDYDIKCCVITSPTYEGVISDVKGISDTLHEHGILLVVDEAHGAHLSFSEEFGKSAIYCGADIVVQSLHKTLPAFTQTAIIHLAEDNKSLDEKLREYISIFQTSSPSYLFFQNMENCIAYCDENRDVFIKHRKNIDEFRENMKKLRNIKLFSPVVTDSEVQKEVQTENQKEEQKEDTVYGFDRSRLTFFAEGMSGEEFSELLSSRFKIVMEMSGIDYVTAVTSFMDEKEDFDYLFMSMKMIDEEIEKTIDKTTEKISSKKTSDDKLYEIYDFTIITTEGEKKIMDCVGSETKDYIYVYPPGIPIIAPFEKISIEMVQEIVNSLAVGKIIRVN